jgi:hypothetical protein
MKSSRQPKDPSKWLEKQLENLNGSDEPSFAGIAPLRGGDSEKMDLVKLNNILIFVNEIYNSDIDWEEKYDLIFTKSVSLYVIREISLDYYDPDTSYEEDVKAFVNAFNEKMAELNELNAGNID